MAGSPIIELVARLDTDESTRQIRDHDIPKIEDNLSDKSINLVCRLDDDSLDNIQEKLAGLKINVAGLTIDNSSLDKNIEQATGKIYDNLKSAAKVDLSMESSSVEQFIDKLSEMNVYGVNIEELQKRFENLKVSIDSITSTFTSRTQDGRKVLSSLSVEGKDSFGQLVKYVETYNAKTGKFVKSTTKVTENLSKVEQAQVRIKKETDSTQKAYNKFLTLQGQLNRYLKQYGENDSLKGQLSDIVKLVNEFDNTAPLEKQRESLIRIDNALKDVKIDIDRIKKSSGSISSVADAIYPSISYTKGSDTASMLNTAKEELNEFFKAKEIDSTASRVKRAVEDTTGSLQRFYVQVERGDKSVETLTYALNEQSGAYEYLGKVIREADNSTDFRRKGIDVQKQIQMENLVAFAAKVKQSGVATEGLIQDIKILKALIERVDDTNSMNEFLDDLDIAKAKFNELNAIAKKESFAQSLSNKIKKLTADMENFAVANERAINSTRKMANGMTFQQKWIQLSSQMAKGSELTADEVKHLREEFNIFGKEASAAGLKGASAFDKFKKSFTTISSYISANMVFNFVKQQLRQLTQEIITIDSAMTELRKVTEATDAEFEAFALSAAKTGKQLGASISEVINATSEFARAGFNLPDAEELGKIATLYKNVGDGIDITEASESIISIVKAFNIEASNSIKVIDKINDVSNKAAIDSGGLGFALQRVASAMVSANNSLDETIALTATANEIVQNPEMVSQGWRTVALRIRGAKLELEEAGEETDGMVESTAKLRDLIKQVSGVDIMLDSSTFKSTYQIIDELARVWKDISDIDQAAILEAIAGKRQSNIVAATLNNYERLEEILRISKDSAGSAMKEQQEYARSIQYSIDRARAAYQEFAQTVISSDVTKELIDVGAELLTIVNNVVKLRKNLKPVIEAISIPLPLNNLKDVVDLLADFSGKIFGNEVYIDDLSENIRVLSEDINIFATDFSNAKDAIQEYKSIVSSTDDLSLVKGDLLSLQNQLISSFGDEAESLDLVNDSYEESINKLHKLSYESYTQWFEDNESIIAQAEKLSKYNVGWSIQDLGYFGFANAADVNVDYSDFAIPEKTEKEIEELYIVKDVAEDIEKIFKNIEGVNFYDGLIKNDLLLSGGIEDAKNQLGELLNVYKTTNDYDQDTYTKIERHYKDLEAILENIESYRKSINIINAEPIPESYITSTENIEALKLIVDGIKDARDEWFEALDEMQKGAFKTVDSMGEALHKLNLGETLSSEEFWELMKYDTEGVLQDVQMINDKFVLSEKQLKSLRDQYIDTQIASLKATNEDLVKSQENEKQIIENAKQELINLGRRGLSNAAYRQQYDEAKKAIDEAEKSLSRYDERLRHNNYLMDQWYAKYDNIVDKQKELEDAMKKLQEQADKYAKAMTDAVQNVIDGLENEKDQLEDEKKLLDDQLDVLEERQKAIEDTIEQYKTVAGLVKDVTDAEIKALEERQKAEEDAVQARIDALKEQHDQQEDANSLLEKQLELQQKLADLEKAKSTKVRTYSAERGWHFDVDKEAVVTAQNAVDEAQKAYDKALSDKEYNDQLKALEDEKDAITKSYDEQIKAYESYYEQWQDILDEQSNAEKEQLAEQIYGSEWREKIKQKDTTILNKFNSDFKSYNAQLSNLVTGEIASLKKSIEAKEDEITAKNNQIDAWKRYKKQVEDTIDAVNGKYDEYTKTLGDVELTESSSYEARETALRTFASEYDALVKDINGYQQQIDALTIPVHLDDSGAREALGRFFDNYADALSDISQALEDTPRGMHLWVDQIKEIKQRNGFSQGGVADFTGVTTVHGSKTKAETVFTSGQSKELYNMVKTGTFASMVADKAYAGLSSAISKINGNTDNSSRVINIHGLTIKTDNPQQFHNQFINEMGKYWNIKLSESRVR